MKRAVTDAIEAEKLRCREHIEEELSAARLRMEEEKQVKILKSSSHHLFTKKK